MFSSPCSRVLASDQMAIESPEHFLRYVIRAVAPYLDQLVLVGGNAVRLYRFHPRAAPTDLDPLLTFDVDFAAPGTLRPAGRQTLSDLVATAGLDRQLFADHDPPVMKFFSRAAGKSARTERGEQYSVEFLTPLTGRGTDREGMEVVTREIQAGITAQALRYLDLLLVDPWRILLAAIQDMKGFAKGTFVQVPHPGLFVVQKILISDRRRPRDRAKDMAYVYDVLGLFRRDLTAIAGTVRETLAKNTAWQRWLERFVQTANELFKSPRSPGVTGARDVLAASKGHGEPPTPDMIHAGVQAFLREF